MDASEGSRASSDDDDDDDDDDAPAAKPRDLRPPLGASPLVVVSR
jgi:hypothetical protein